MNSLLWFIHTGEINEAFINAFVGFLIVLCVFQHHFILICLKWLYDINSVKGTSGNALLPSGMVIIPSLLRNADDYNAITTTVDSCVGNKYPGLLLVIVSIDGANECPNLVNRLKNWTASMEIGENVRVYVAESAMRAGKMMAVHAGLDFVKGLVSNGIERELPKIYFSIDGDSWLSNNALEYLAAKLLTPHPITGNIRRIVAGKVSIPTSLFWTGWKNFFTVKGMIYANVAREFAIANMSRFNFNLIPKVGVPGALYCTHTDLLIKAPYYMGFLKAVKPSSWIKWWFGAAPPCFAESNATPCPEILTGASDDTCMAFIASIANWHNGTLSLESPRTPLHAFGRLFVQFFVERSHDYEPNAIAYTHTPTTVRGLWLQRVRWNSSSVECFFSRFLSSFLYNWNIAVPALLFFLVLFRTILECSVYYIILPFIVLNQSSIVSIGLVGYAMQTLSNAVYVGLSLIVDQERRDNWRIVYTVPMSGIYSLVINFTSCLYGIIRDCLLFGNRNGFAPETTLIKGGGSRIAILFRWCRFIRLCVRSVINGDVPFSWRWFGWREFENYADNGYVGWTSKNKPRYTLFGK